MDEIAMPSGDKPAKRPNPISVLPHDWREPVRFFCLAYSDVLKSPSGIAALLRLWSRDEGLTLDEARRVLRRLLKPDEVGRIQFAGQLLARLAQLVAEEIQTRRRREETEQRRATEQRERTTAAAPDEIRQLLGRIGPVGLNDA